MPGQFIQHDSSNVGIGIPRMVRLNPFVSTRIELEAQQSVVFDVIDEETASEVAVEVLASIFAWFGVITAVLSLLD